MVNLGLVYRARIWTDEIRMYINQRFRFKSGFKRAELIKTRVVNERTDSESYSRSRIRGRATNILCISTLSLHNKKIIF
jgi:hypothetical protein